jgi:hypothetical protein
MVTVHLFYPQSLAAKAEDLELFSVEKQLLNSHSGNLNLSYILCETTLVELCTDAAVDTAIWNLFAQPSGNFFILVGSRAVMII